MAATVSRATSVLLGAGVSHQVHRYRHDRRVVSYGAEAVDALCARLGVHPHRVLKTLVVTMDGTLVVAVLPVPDRCELKAVAAALGGRRAQLAERAAVERATGYVLGGVSPLGQRTRLPTVLHSPVMDHPTVLCSGGLQGLEVELKPTDLQRLTHAVLAHITQG